jgi:ribosomal protein S18 acetylase RimI-like enzyme
VASIRAYVDSDYEAVKRILEEGRLFDAVWDSRGNLRQKMHRNPNSLLVAEVRNRVVGCVYILEDGWGAFVFRLAVRPALRRQGVGSQLMNAAEKYILQKGIREMALFVDDADEDLKRWYAERGYSATGRYRSMYKVLDGTG